MYKRLLLLKYNIKLLLFNFAVVLNVLNFNFDLFEGKTKKMTRRSLRDIDLVCKN